VANVFATSPWAPIVMPTLGTPSSATLRNMLTDETGTGSLMFADSIVTFAPRRLMSCVGCGAPLNLSEKSCTYCKRGT